MEAYAPFYDLRIYVPNMNVLANFLCGMVFLVLKYKLV